jgi:tetratricopeptide (TPR) repeat protein
VDELRAIAARVLDHPGADEVLQGQVLALVGDAAVVRGDLPGAMAHYLEAARHRLDDAGARALAVKIEALDDPEIAAAVLPYLGGGVETALFAVRDLLERKPAYATGWYLLGRRLLSRGEEELAAAYLERALGGNLPTPALEREAHRLHALALMGTSRAAEGCEELAILARTGEPGPRLEAEDLLALCRHEAGARTARR